MLTGSPDERWTEPQRDRGALAPALVLAAALHALPLVALLAQQQSYGSDLGREEAIAIDFITAADFAALERSLVAGRESARPSPESPSLSPSLAPTPNAAQAQPNVVPTAPQIPATLESTSEPAKRDETNLEAPAENSVGRLSAAELEALLQAPIANTLGEMALPDVPLDQQPLTAPAPKVSAAEQVARSFNRSNFLRKGNSDAIDRLVARELERNKPVSSIAGRLVVTFGLSERGTFTNVRLMQSSGKPELDERILIALRKMQLTLPPGIPVGNREFTITYEYQ